MRIGELGHIIVLPVILARPEMIVPVLSDLDPFRTVYLRFPEHGHFAPLHAFAGVGIIPGPSQAFAFPRNDKQSPKLLPNNREWLLLRFLNTVFRKDFWQLFHRLLSFRHRTRTWVLVFEIPFCGMNPALYGPQRYAQFFRNFSLWKALQEKQR